MKRMALPPIFPLPRSGTPGLLLGLLLAGCSGGESSLVNPPPPPAPGALTLTVAGLPAGASAAIQVTGPGGFTSSLSAAQTLTGLTPGPYALAASQVLFADAAWAPAPASQTVTVPAGGTASASVTYAVASGSLALAFAGVPAGGTPSVSIAGPNGFNQTVATGTTLHLLPPGEYRLTAAAFVANGITYAPAPAAQTIAIPASATPIQASIAWAASTGSLLVGTTGLPAGSDAALTVTGPEGFSANLTQTTVLTNLPAGVYLVSAGQVTVSGNAWLPDPPTQQAVVTVGALTVAGVTYSPSTGSMALTVSGLPQGTAATVTLAGPDTISVSVSTTTTVAGLAPGLWKVTAGPVGAADTTYVADPASQNLAVVAGTTTSASITYGILGATTLNLRIETAYLTQAIQRPDHGVELVAGRNAFLRVFVVANQSATARPPVRVRLYHGQSQVAEHLIEAPGGTLPQVLTEGILASSWNLLVPGALIQPGLRLLAEVDPFDETPETNPNDNTFPAGGTPLPVTVRDPLPFRLRLVPVMHTNSGTLGDVTPANLESYLVDLRKMWPIAGMDADIRETYTSNAPALQSNTSAGGWSMVLSEILALRNSVDLSDRYYYGVVQVGYTSGIAGLGYVGSPGGTARAAVGWDRVTSRAHVLAHELGHNFGRWHAPCGNPSGVDASYPHAGGRIGFWGLDLTNMSLKSPTAWNDLMGYCSNNWVSDYNWNAVMAFRMASPVGAPPAATAPAGADDDGLLVWGRITRDGVALEPAFRMPALGRPLPEPGPFQVEGRDAAGTLLFSHPFQPLEVADIPGGGEYHFAFVLPVGAAADRITSLRVTGPAMAASERRAAAPPPGQPRDPEAVRGAGAQRRVSWDASRHPMALIRNPATGEILSFARGGEITIVTGATELDLQLSDGVRVERRRVVVQ
jgi:hypothetical protein